MMNKLKVSIAFYSSFLAAMDAHNLSKLGDSIQILGLRKLLGIYPHKLWISIDSGVVPPTGIEPVSHA
jgi:hypothetical protein